MTFTQFNLDSQITKALSICGYTQPTPIQSHCIPTILQGKDVVACAQTGTGKTAAFMLPVLHHLSQKAQTSKPRILVLTPTRELSTQITQAATKYGKFLRFNMANLVGGVSYRQQIRDLSRAVDIIVATPGRLLDHMRSRRVDLSGIEILILDEADRMLDMGFIDDVQQIANSTPNQRQTLLFSATIDNNVSQIVKNLLKNPIHVDLTSEKISPANIHQVVYMADNAQHKHRLLHHFLKNGNIFKGIIFSATKLNADKLAHELCNANYKAAALHGDLKQSMRNRTIEQMRKNKVQFLVATDVASRGIDISDVTHVINYDLPRFCEDYVHRIGRTGRAGKKGIAISFATTTDARHLQKIEKYTKQKLPREVVIGLEPSNNASKKTSHKPDRHQRPFQKNKKFSQQKLQREMVDNFEPNKNGRKKSSHKPAGHQQPSQKNKKFSQQKLPREMADNFEPNKNSRKKSSHKPAGHQQASQKNKKYIPKQFQKVTVDSFKPNKNTRKNDSHKPFRHKRKKSNRS